MKWPVAHTIPCNDTINPELVIEAAEATDNIDRA